MRSFTVAARRRALSIAAAGLLAVPSLAQAQAAPPAEVTVVPVVDYVQVAGAVGVAGAAALVAAFGVSIGFRMAKKGYAWATGWI